MMDLGVLLAGESTALRAVARGSMKDTIAQKIATLIATGVLAVGDPLPSERDLAAALSVSRETVRGALLILSSRGILSVVQGARTTVATTELGDMAVEAARYRSISAYALEDVHEARLLVEERVARAAARRIDAETLAQLRASVRAQAAALDDPVRFLICDREFHTAIYRASGNAVLADIARDLYSYLLDHRRRAVSEPHSIATSVEDHCAILKGLEARDPDRVALAFRTHEARIYATTQALIARGAAAETTEEETTTTRRKQ